MMPTGPGLSAVRAACMDAAGALVRCQACIEQEWCSIFLGTVAALMVVAIVGLAVMWRR